MTTVAELAVVIIFDNPGGPIACPGQQGIAPRHAHGHAQRILMRGSDKGKPRICLQTYARSHIQPLFIHRYTNHPFRRTYRIQDRGNTGIGGVLYPGKILPAHQHQTSQKQALLCTRRHNDLLRLAAHRA